MARNEKLFITRLYTEIIITHRTRENSMELERSRVATQTRKVDLQFYYINPIVAFAINNTKIYNKNLYNS